MAGTLSHLASSAFQQGSLVSYLPVVCNLCGGWFSGIGIQNVGPSSATVQVKYYTGAGVQVGNTQSYTLGASRGRTLVSEIPSGGPYSAVLSSDQPIVATVNMIQDQPSTDLYMTYNAPNR